ncbi:MAG: aminotransferase class I/II-fold pyridoxal phosphate-dependent enzyme, partial [Planctomycetota bacterium]|nr:aminotransferase class I/II-fold pyridoxal phosphate-dependent enzyme [Planctomycetota bacterium]
PPIAAATLVAIDLVAAADDLRAALWQKTANFRQRLTALGFAVKAGEHPIIPIMIGEAGAAQEMAKRLLARGVYVVGFSYPVVPKGEARIRVQISAAHSDGDLDLALEAFAACRREI